MTFNEIESFIMLKKYIIPTCFILLIILFSCEKTKDQPVGDVVINEVMPINSSTAADQNGEYDDWIELYNITDESIDISGYYLSDKTSNILKWQIPAGTTITGNGYLIIWADEDSTQVGLHSNFKLSSEGEVVVLSKSDGSILDEIIFPAQTLELSYSRFPNGSGNFKWQNATFGKTNGHSK
jgi:hypothetical protein